MRNQKLFRYPKKAEQKSDFFAWQCNSAMLYKVRHAAR